MLPTIYEKYPYLRVELGTQVVGYYQDFLIHHQLAQIWKKYQLNPPTLAEKFKKSPGHCLGLTVLWLYSKWLTFTHPEQSTEYNNERFKNTVTTLATWDDQQSLPPEVIQDIQTFGSTIDYFQNPGDYMPGLTQNVKKPMNLRAIYKDGKQLKQEYTIATSVTLQQLSDLLTELAKDNKLDNKLIFVMLPNHATGLFKQGDDYYFYDPDDNRGEYLGHSADEAAAAIFDSCKKSVSNPSIGLIICDFVDDRTAALSPTYPAQQELLGHVHSTLPDQDSLEAGADIASQAGCLESMRFFLETLVLNSTDGVSLSKLKEKLLRQAGGTMNYPDIVKELLYDGNGVDPNISIRWETRAEPEKPLQSTLLHAASERGYKEAIEVLLQDPRIDLERKDSSGKTALEYAATDEIRAMITAKIQHRQPQ